MASPAETLRTAAEKLRTLATMAEPGPWSAECMGSEGYMVYGPRREAGTVRDRMRRVPAQVYRGSHEECRDNSAYIAAMHPGVGLALAKALALDADALQMALDQGEDVGTGYDEELAIARLILGGQS